MKKSLLTHACNRARADPRPVGCFGRGEVGYKATLAIENEMLDDLSGAVRAKLAAERMGNPRAVRSGRSSEMTVGSILIQHVYPAPWPATRYPVRFHRRASLVPTLSDGKTANAIRCRRSTPGKSGHRGSACNSTTTPWTCRVRRSSAGTPRATTGFCDHERKLFDQCDAGVADLSGKSGPFRGR